MIRFKVFRTGAKMARQASEDHLQPLEQQKPRNTMLVAGHDDNISLMLGTLRS